MMKKIAIAAVVVLFGSAAQAAPAATDAPSKPRSAQQQKMAQCSKDAKGKKGDERKALMKACLSKKAEPAG
jgi:psiF repeat